MKKIIAMILCLATVLSFAACGGKEDPVATTGEDTTAPATTTAATTEGTVPEATQPADTAPTETKPEETKPEETKPTQPQPSVEPTTEGTTEPTTPLMQKKTPKEQFEALVGVVGKSLPDALKALGWQKEGVTEEEDGLYALPFAVYLDGTKYRLYLSCGEDLDTVVEVLYRAEFPFDSTEAAGAALQAVSTVDNWVGKNNLLEEDGSFALRNTTQKEVAAGLSEDKYAYCTMVWDCSKFVTKTQTAYLKECEEADSWQASGMKATLGVTMEISHLCKKEAGKVISDTCRIDFLVGVIPESAWW